MQMRNMLRKIPWKLLILLATGSSFMMIEHIPGNLVKNHTVLVFSEKLGEALVLAAVLAAVVDKTLKHEFLKEVSEDILSAAAGHTLPDRLKSTISTIIQSPYIRKNFIIKFTISDIADRPGFVLLTMHASYDVVNMRDEWQPYFVRTAIDKNNYFSHEGRLLALSISDGTEHSFNDQQMLKNRKEDRFYYYFEKEVTLRPRGALPLNVATTRSIVYPETWFYVLDILEITDGITVEFAGSDRFEWDVHFGPRRYCDCDGRLWKCAHVFLPGQFVRVSWKRKAS
jgi:hypothetical protein